MVDGFGWSRPKGNLDWRGIAEDGRPDVFGEMWSDGRGQECSGTDPIMDQITMHANVRGDLTVPVTSGLQLVEAILKSVFVVGAVSVCVNVSFVKFYLSWI